MSGNTKDFKVKAGIQPTSYFEGVGTVTSGSVTVGYDLANGTYDNKLFQNDDRGATPVSIRFKSDGTKLYVLEANNDFIYQYSLSTAWDISTASYDSVQFDVNAPVVSPRDFYIKPDGTKFYITDNSDTTIHQFSLSTAWDMSTASYDSVSLVTSEISSLTGIEFNSTGDELYVTDYTTQSVEQYTLSTAWNISTGSHTYAYDISSLVDNPWSVRLNNDGTQFYVNGASDSAGLHSIFIYNMVTAYDLSTAAYSGTLLDVSTQSNTPRGFEIGDSGAKLYQQGVSVDNIYQYTVETSTTTKTLDLSTGSVFEVTPTSDIQVTLSNPADSGTVSGATLLLDGAAASTYDITNAVYDSVSFSVASQETQAYSIAFNNDGTKMYIVGNVNDSVYQYSLSTAFDLSTASYDSVSFDVSSQDTNAFYIVFNNDGTKMYICGLSNETVFQYSLSTAFDLSTASYDSVSFSVASQDSLPYAIAFNNDGTKMYMVGNANGSVHQYSLSTAFDLSTASYDSVSFSVASQDTAPQGIAFNNDGTKMYMVGLLNGSIFQYSLSTAFDLSTASYDIVSFDVSSQDTDPRDISFNNYGTKMYVVGTTTDTIYQYSTGSEATITYDTAIEWPSGTAPTSPAIGETDVLTFNTRDGGSTYSGVLAIDGAQ